MLLVILYPVVVVVVVTVVVASSAVALNDTLYLQTDRYGSAQGETKAIYVNILTPKNPWILSTHFSDSVYDWIPTDTLGMLVYFVFAKIVPDERKPRALLNMRSVLKS